MDWTPFLSLLCILVPAGAWTDTKVRRFKDGFLFGVASSAYQVEGAWDTDGRGPSIWDHHLHANPETTADHSNGDEAADSYHQFKRDVEMLREIGVDHYRFSVSWPRVLPTGFSNSVNEKGLQYYDNLIDELLKYNIEPMVTLYHFDLPQPLQDLGGWTNPLVAEWFEDYARVVFDRYASKVKLFITINQPSICMETYSSSAMPPGVEAAGIGDYLCVKNIMVAHAKAYRLYEREFKRKFNGSVGISISINWADPVNNKTENVKATEEFRQFYFGIFTHPIWSESGDFPRLVKDVVARNSHRQGYPASRLPRLSAEEVRLLKGSADFLGLNHYTTFLVQRPKPGEAASEGYGDANVRLSYGEQWKPSRSEWLKSVPYGLYKVCIHLNSLYDYPKMIITENGWSTNKGLADQSRVEYLKGYLSALLLALEDGSEIMGFTFWSLMDNFEWLAGYSERFGLYEVDFNSPQKTRKPRHSAHFYKSVIETRVVDMQWSYQNKSEMEISVRRMRKREEL